MNDEQSQQKITGLEQTVRALTQRVWRLEQAVTELSVDALRATPPRPTATPAPAPAPTPAPTPAATVPAPARVTPPSLPPPLPPKPPKPPFDWGKLGEQLFAARTLAWAGGVATVLGIVLLFVMAASRGWITPGMRVGIGTAVSLALLGAAIELDRRSWRSDAILSAAGVGIGGLYASLWAATSLYHLVASAAAAPLAGLIAALAVAAALRIRQEPLAVFGMSAAMLAPILVSKDVTTGGVLFGAVMVAAALPLLVRTGWRWLVASVWAIGFAETLALLALSADHIGFGGPVVAAAVMTALVVCLTFLLELLPRERTRLSALGSLTAASAFTMTLGAAALFGGSRELDGHSLAGIALAGMTGVWLLLAFVPAAVRRPHANLADLLAGFGLTSAAIATGLLGRRPGARLRLDGRVGHARRPRRADPAPQRDAQPARDRLGDGLSAAWDPGDARRAPAAARHAPPRRRRLDRRLRGARGGRPGRDRALLRPSHVREAGAGRRLDRARSWRSGSCRSGRSVPSRP